MRSTDERMAEVLGRAKVHEAEIRRRRQRAVALGGGFLSVVAVVLVGVGFSSAVSGASDAASVAGQLGLMGSVFADGSALGYVVVGLFGLALGAAVTAIAFRLGHGCSVSACGIEDGISVHTSSETEISSAKVQVGKAVSESMYTNSCEAHEAQNDEGRRP